MINESSFGMPYSHEAEVSVLGSCLINKDALAEVAGTLLPEDFYEERHKILFQVMTKCMKRAFLWIWSPSWKGLNGITCWMW